MSGKEMSRPSKKMNKNSIGKELKKKICPIKVGGLVISVLQTISFLPHRESRPIRYRSY